MKAIVPTGGRGTRMQPLTFSVNKHFIPIANKPLIFYPIEAVAEAGIKEICVTYNPGYLEAVKMILADGRKWGVKITYVLQEKPAGLANIVEVCERALGGEPFVLHLGDNIFTKGIKKEVAYFQKNKPNGLVTMIRHPENKRMGVPYFDKQGRLTKYVEKPANPPHDFAVPGLYFADANFFKMFAGKDRLVPSARGEFEIPDAYQWLIDHKYRIDVIEYGGKWLDPGKFGDWIEANEYLLDTRLVSCVPNKGISKSVIKNRVSIGDGVVIENSHVENSVVMERVKINNVKTPIDSSLIGAETEVVRSEGPTRTHQLFVGNKCLIKL